jgi:hypothetical protein
MIAAQIKQLPVAASPLFPKLPRNHLIVNRPLHAELPPSDWLRSNFYWDTTDLSDCGLFDIRHLVLVEY